MDDSNSLEFDDPQMAKAFLKLIDKRIDLKFKELRYDKTYSAIVIAVHTGNADIQLQGSTSTILAVPDKTGVTLLVNDQVFVEAMNGSLNNLVIKYKK